MSDTLASLRRKIGGAGGLKSVARSTKALASSRKLGRIAPSFPGRMSVSWIQSCKSLAESPPARSGRTMD